MHATGIVVTPLSWSDAPQAAEIMRRAYTFDYEMGAVAYEKLFGASPSGSGWALGAWINGDLAGVASGAGQFIRILATDPPMQGRGIGNELLKKALEYCLPNNTHMRVAAEPGNYLVPGIDSRDDKTIQWLLARGFVHAQTNRNLTIDLEDNKELLREKARCCALQQSANKYKLCFIRGGGLPGLLAKTLPQTVVFEASKGIVLAALHQGAIASFAVINSNNKNLWWFGPIVTMPEHREQGLGTALTLIALDGIGNNGHAMETEIAWIGPLEFYTRIVPVKRMRTFFVFEARR